MRFSAARCSGSRCAGCKLRGMDAAARLEVIEQLFFSDRRAAMEKLSELVESAQGKQRAAAMKELVKRVDHEHPGLSAYLALAGGALVEDGEESGTLGRALVAPLVRSLTAAARMRDHVAHLPDAEVDDDGGETGEHGDDDEEDTGERAANGSGAHGHSHSHDH